MTASFISLIQERGYIHQATDLEGLETLLKTPSVMYIGFDCTAASLHAGSLVQIMLLRHWQQCGHTPIILLGGGTSLVGDPSGKDESRQLLTPDSIAHNKHNIQRIFEQYLSFDEAKPNKAILVDNADWLSEINYIDFLRDYGRHFSINRMLGFDSVKLRLEREQSLSFLEFNYMLLQAYDFVQLHKRYGCRLQIGGSDQWGNIVNGIELQRRLGGQELFGLTTPLLTTSSGKKMGKTADGAVWLDQAMLSSYDYWQYFRNCDDGDVGKFLRLFTELPMDEIARLEQLQGQEINEAKKILATEVTALCHGAEAASHALETARKTFEEGQTGQALPVVNVLQAELEAGIPAFKLLSMVTNDSNGAARRLIRGGGAKLNDVPIQDENQLISMKDADGDQIKLSAGKKKHALLQWHS